MKKYCSYLRVSTQRQGAQGLGIEAQRKMCADFIERNEGEHVQEFMDVESGTHRDRKGLWRAIDFCKVNGCALVIAKLDRLARDVEFTFRVINTGIEIHFTDMPVVNSMILGVFASVAQYEREMIAKRTKDALAVKKAQGCKLGAATEAYRVSREQRSDAEKAEIAQRISKTKNSRHKESRDVQAFLKVLHNIFPEYTKAQEPKRWKWEAFTCRGTYKSKLLAQMSDYKEMDATGTLFRNWDFTDEATSVRKLRSYMQATRNSIIN